MEVNRIDPSLIAPIFSKYGVPESVWLPILNVESGGNANALGDYLGGVPRSVGLFQLNRYGGLGAGYTLEDLLDPATNAEIAASAMSKAYQKGLSLGLSGYDLTQYTAYNAGWPTKQGVKALGYDKVVQAYEPKLQKEYTALMGTSTTSGGVKTYTYNPAAYTEKPANAFYNLDGLLNPPEGSGILQSGFSYVLILLLLVGSFGLIALGIKML